MRTSRRMISGQMVDFPFADDLVPAGTAPVTDPISVQFEQFAGRPPKEGDHYSEAPERHPDPESGDLVTVTRCWEYEHGRWEGYVSVSRGATWAR